MIAARPKTSEGNYVVTQRLSLTVVSVCLALTVTYLMPAPSEAVEDDLLRIQGCWRLTEGHSHGYKYWNAYYLVDVFAIIEGDILTIPFGRDSPRAQFSLSQSKRPKEIDLKVLIPESELTPQGTRSRVEVERSLTEVQFTVHRVF
jgi:uncharacterized protein (TIGR03067 family)